MTTIKNKKQYDLLAQRQRVELLALKREQKINILGQYFATSDDLLNQIDSIPDQVFQNPKLLREEMVRIDTRAIDYNSQIFPSLVAGNKAMVNLGIEHTIDYPVIFKNEVFTIDTGFGDSIIDHLFTPFQKDVDLLKKAGVFEAVNYDTTIMNRSVKNSFNRFNKMIENISTTLPKDQQLKYIQAVMNYADSTDPLGASVRGLELLYGIKPENDYKLSESIWGKGRRDEIYNFVIDEANKGTNPNDIKNTLEERLKKSGQGGEYYKAERVVDTEMQRAYNHATVESTRLYNQDGYDKLVIIQSLSPTHSIKDICDELAGTYDPDGKIPEIPRHPFCTCIEKRVFASDYSGKIKNETGTKIKSSKYNQETYLI